MEEQIKAKGSRNNEIDKPAHKRTKSTQEGGTTLGRSNSMVKRKIVRKIVKGQHNMSLVEPIEPKSA